MSRKTKSNNDYMDSTIASYNPYAYPQQSYDMMQTAAPAPYSYHSPAEFNGYSMNPFSPTPYGGGMNGMGTTPNPDPMVMYEVVPIKRHKRNLLKFILLNILTLGIYGIVVMCHISQEINLIATDYDRKSTPFYCLACFLSFVTLGIYGIIYMNGLCSRIGRELKRRSINYKFDEGSYWGWGIFGCFILVGPFIFCHKLLKAMDKLIDDYNIFG